ATSGTRTARRCREHGDHQPCKPCRQRSGDGGCAFREPKRHIRKRGVHPFSPPPPPLIGWRLRQRCLATVAHAVGLVQGYHCNRQASGGRGSGALPPSGKKRGGKTCYEQE